MSAEPLPGSKADHARRAAPMADPGLPLPTAVDMERCVISALMQAPAHAMDVIGARLRGEHFSVPAHAALWDICVQQINTGRPVDPVSVTQVLYDRGLVAEFGGPAFVSEIFTASPNPAHAAHYGTQVHEKWRQRQCALHCSTALSAILAGIEPHALTEIIGDLESRLMVLGQETLNTTKGLRTGEDVMMDTLATLQTRHRNKGKILGLQFGFPDLDRRINGFQREDFLIVCARPAMGKTSLATSFAENVAIESVNRENRPVLMFTLEMSDAQIMERSLLGRARIGLGKGRTGMFSDAEAAVLYAAKKSLAATRGQSTAARRTALILESLDSLEAYCTKKGRFENMNKGELADFFKEARGSIERFAAAVTATANGLFHFYDGYGVTVQEIRSTIRQWIRRIGWTRESNAMAPPLVVIDYLQLVKPSQKKNIGDPRLTAVEVCEAMKGTAKELGIVIMGLAQVKTNDKRPDAEPQLSDIKESGAFGEYPDYVFTLHRQSYYKHWDKLTEEQQEDWNTRATSHKKAREASGLPEDEWNGEAYYRGHAKIGIKKARHCPTDDITVFFRGPEVRFIPITDELYSTNAAHREQPAEDLF